MVRLLRSTKSSSSGSCRVVGKLAVVLSTCARERGASKHLEAIEQMNDVLIPHGMEDDGQKIDDLVLLASSPLQAVADALESELSQVVKQEHMG